jgi:hypothetical protein
MGELNVLDAAGGTGLVCSDSAIYSTMVYVWQIKGHTMITQPRRFKFIHVMIGSLLILVVIFILPSILNSWNISILWGDSSPSLTSDAEHFCAKSAYVGLINPGPNAGHYADWQITDRTGTYNLPPFSLGPGESLRIWRGVDLGNMHNLYLGEQHPTWYLDESDSPTIEHHSVFGFVLGPYQMSFFHCFIEHNLSPAENNQGSRR